MSKPYKKPKNPGYLLKNLTHRPFLELRDMYKHKKSMQSKDKK